MKPIGDEGGRQPVVGKLGPKKIWVPGQQGRDTVAEMGGEGGAGIDRCGHLGRRCVGVTKGDMNAPLRQSNDVSKGGVEMWRERHHAHKVAAA